MEYFWTILIQAVLALGLAYYFLNRKFNYWSDRGIPGPKPVFLFGNLWSILREGMIKKEKEWVQQFGKTYGFYQAMEPRYTIADAELIKQVMVKDFAVFVNRDVQRFDHEIWSNNLFNSEDEQWRRIRAITSPTFTSGKLKGMHGLMETAIDKLANYFNKVIQTKGGKMNAKEVITGFTIDVIASTSFATETDANGDRSKKNPFLENGVGLFNINPFRFLAFLALPNSIAKRVGAELGLSMKNFQFFVDLSKAIMEQRKKEGGKVKRNDLVQLLMDAFVYESELQGNNYDKLTATDGKDEVEESKQNGHTHSDSIRRKLTEEEIIAQCILFFVAGFETTATTICNALYFLSNNPEIQERLVSELDQALDGLDVNSKAYFDKVNGDIPYLEAIIKETLRFCPPVTRLQRRVGVDNYKLGGVPLEKDITVDIAVYAVHHLEEYYPEPERFNPDRFMPENKHNLVPYTYIPFGLGPRNCLGMRFAYQEIRLCLAKIIREFRFEPQSTNPPKFNNIGILSFIDLPLKVAKR